MEFSVPAALLAGLVATIVMSVMMKVATLAGLTRMPDMALVSGGMLSGDRRQALVVGSVIHFIMMGTIAFGLLYAGVLVAAGSASPLVGGVIGLAHGVLVGAVALPMMPAMHPRMGAAAAGAASVADDGGGLRLSAPGPFGVRWGAMTPVGLVVGHVLYGAVAAAVYGATV